MPACVCVCVCVGGGGGGGPRGLAGKRCSLVGGSGGGAASGPALVSLVVSAAPVNHLHLPELGGGLGRQPPCPQLHRPSQRRTRARFTWLYVTVRRQA